MLIALASPSVARSFDEALAKVERFIVQAAERSASVVCFPEAYLPGLRGQDFDVYAYEREHEQRALRAAARLSRAHRIASILCLERIDSDGRRIAAVVHDAHGRLLGAQTKNQLDPSEEPFYLPGTQRRVFDVDGLRFGVSICHEGWRYPETVRWAAVRGAQVVFHPQHTGYEHGGARLARWGADTNPYYERAMTLRSLENTIYFASVNYALRFPESATSLIDPSGACQAHLPYGEEGVLVERLDLGRATGALARRFAPERHLDASMPP